MWMQCPSCRQANPEGSRFCLQCGAAFGARCRECSAELPAGARFCNQCGAAVEGKPAAPGARVPRDYTPKHLAEKILTQKSALEGERKQVTVLFADVKGSMDMQEGIDPEQWHRVLDRFFQILADGVHRFEGTVNQYTGDGIMALFGAPIAHEDHAQRACYAALSLVDALRDYARELRRESGLDFSTRIGINSGEVVVGKIGDDLRMDYTAQGHTVGLAARMESLAEPGKVYVSGNTAERVKGYFSFDDLGPFKVKGVGEPIAVFELTGVGTLRTRFDVSRARGLTRFVGRDDDMQILQAAFESAKRGKGRAIGVVANAGVGKSRLCFEFAERCRADGVLVLQASGVPHGKNIPLLPVLDIFRGYFGIDARDDPRQAREKVAGRLLLIDDAFRDVLPLVFDFLGMPDPERPLPTLDPETRRRRLVAIVRRLIERGYPNGFVILIEDLHWVDAASDGFVADYVDAIPHGAGLLLLNFRPEYRADWMSKTWYQQLPLEPLGAAAIGELLCDLLGDDASVAGLAERIHQRTRGNPYFTEELVRSMIESGALEGKRGAYRLTAPVETLEVPYSVHAVLSARIDRLAEREKELLQTAAVIGKEFQEPILAAVADLPGPALAEALAALSNGEFIHQQALYPTTEYAFAHPLTQEVALGSQLQERRRHMHAAVARAIQDAEPDRLDENAALLAHHYEEAGEPLEAARFHARTAAWVGTKDLDGTLRHWQRVRDLVRMLPEDAETVGLRLAACVQILNTGGFRLGLSEAAVDEIYEEGSQLAERLGDVAAMISVRGAYNARRVGLGRVREVYDLAMENLKVADRFGVPSLRAAARVGAVYVTFQLGRLDECAAHLDVAMELSSGDLAMGRQQSGFSYFVFFASVRAIVLDLMGRLEDAGRACAQALRVARDSGVVENLGWALGNLAYHAELSGEVGLEELGDARVATLEALRIAEELGSPFSRAIAYEQLGTLHIVSEEWELAERFYTDALDLMRTRRVRLESECLDLAHLAQAQLGNGKLALARATAEEAVACGRERGQRVAEISAQITLALAVAAEQGSKASAGVERALARAGELIRDTGARTYEPRLVEARARVAHACGDGGAAERHLREALALYRRIGATGHERRLVRELEGGST
jgi:class 3 adenylate cyclase/tetratricopeptide (TPR) repeat protein